MSVDDGSTKILSGQEESSLHVHVSSPLLDFLFHQSSSLLQPKHI
jgi:hypothetical protein